MVEQVLGGAPVQVSREGQVIRIAGVGDGEFLRQTAEAVVEFQHQRIADARAGGSALDAVALADRHMVGCTVYLDRLTLGLGHDHGQAGGDLIAIAIGDQQAADTRKGDAGKEVLQVQVHEHLPAHMGFGSGADAAPDAEPVRGLADRQPRHQQSVQLALNGLEPAFRRHDQSLATGTLGDGEGDVMRGPFTFAVDGEAQEPAFAQAESFRKFGLAAPQRQTQALQLLRIGDQVAYPAVAGAHGAGEKAIGLGPVHHFGALDADMEAHGCRHRRGFGQ